MLMTEGTWIAEKPDMFGDYNIVLHDGDDRRVIAAVVSNMRPAEEVAANAKVVAASKDLLTALVNAPIPGRGEEMMAFRDRQDKWMRDFYAPAIAKATSIEGASA